LACFGYLVEDGLGCRGWVCGLGDWTAYDQHGGSCGDGLGGGGDALLVADVGACGANSRDYKKGIGACGRADGGDLFGGADEAIYAGLGGELCEAEDLVGWGSGDACACELSGVHAGEDSDGEETRGAGCFCGFRCGGHHGGASAGVEGEEAGSGLRGGADGSGYGVGDVVELEIEEDVEAAVSELADDCVAGGVVKLHADFEPLAGVAESVD